MSLKQRKRVLYFIKGRQPTEEQINRAVAMSEDVVFRNANMVGPQDKCEKCDAVMGFPPKQYKDADIPVISVKKKDPNEGGGKAGTGEGTTTAPKAPAPGKQADAKS